MRQRGDLRYQQRWTEEREVGEGREGYRGPRPCGTRRRYPGTSRRSRHRLWVHRRWRGRGEDLADPKRSGPVRVRESCRSMPRSRPAGAVYQAGDPEYQRLGPGKAWTRLEQAQSRGCRWAPWGDGAQKKSCCRRRWTQTPGRESWCCRGPSTSSFAWAWNWCRRNVVRRADGSRPGRAGRDA